MVLLTALVAELFWFGPRLSAGHDWQADERVIAHLADGFQRHVALALDVPLIILLEEDGSDVTNDGIIVRQDADNLCAMLDLVIHALDGVDAVQLGAVLLREGKCSPARRARPYQ